MSPVFHPGTPGHDAQLAISAWNMMNGEMDWSALPFIVEMLGIDDPESLIHQLCAIRDHQRKVIDNG